MKNTSSYQKLKLENEKLKQDIFNLVRNANKHEGISTKARYEMIFDGADAALYGNSATRIGNGSDGIINSVSK